MGLGGAGRDREALAVVDEFERLSLEQFVACRVGVDVDSQPAVAVEEAEAQARQP